MADFDAAIRKQLRGLRFQLKGLRSAVKSRESSLGRRDWEMVRRYDDIIDEYMARIANIRRTVERLYYSRGMRMPAHIRWLFDDIPGRGPLPEGREDWDYPPRFTPSVPSTPSAGGPPAHRDNRSRGARFSDWLYTGITGWIMENIIGPIIDIWNRMRGRGHDGDE